MKNAFSSLIALLAISTLVLPASAALEVLNDEDLDSITAAGQPTVVLSENGTASQSDNSIQTLHLPTDAQHGLRALAITNVVGEAQLLVNLNIVSISGDIAGVDQRNFSMQSWGASMERDGEVVSGSPGNVEENKIAPNCLEKCGLGSTLIDNDTNYNVTNTASAPLIDFAASTGDIIVDGFDGATAEDNSLATLAFEANAQTDLSALFIANIAGRTQAAFNINIASSTLNLFPDTNSAFTDPAASSSAVLKQVNSGVQFRGTPINAAASIFVEHTP